MKGGRNLPRGSRRFSFALEVTAKATTNTEILRCAQDDGLCGEKCLGGVLAFALELGVVGAEDEVPEGSDDAEV